MKLNPQIQLAFNGQCEAAFRCYEQHLNGTNTLMLTWGNSPMKADTPPGWDAKILHATLKIGNAVITGGDVPPDGTSHQRALRLCSKWTILSQRSACFRRSRKNGKIVLPLQETFWAGRFGMLVDQFGIPWSINCERAVEPTP